MLKVMYRFKVFLQIILDTKIILIKIIIAVHEVTLIINDLFAIFH